MIKKVFFGGTAGLFFVVTTVIANVVRSSLAVRYLFAVEAGIWFLFLNVIVFLSFCDFGLSPTLSREIGFATKKRDTSLRISNLYCTVRRLVNYISLVTIFLLFCFGYFYLYQLKFDVVQMHRILSAFALFGVGVVVQFQANPSLAVIYGVGSIATERYLRIFGVFVGVFCSYIAVARLGYGLYGLVIGYLIQVLVIYVLARYFLSRNVQFAHSGKYLSVILKRIVAPSARWTVVSIGANLIFQISNFIIASLMGIQYVSQFAILLQIVILIPAMTTGTIGYVITPFVAKAKGEHDLPTIKYFFTVSTRVSGAIALVAAVFLYLFIDPITTVWLGKNFVINKDALLLLLIMGVLEAHHVACAVVTMATGYVKFALLAIVAGITNLVLSLIFIYFGGIFGAALAIFITQLLTNNWYAVFISLKHVGYPVKKYLRDVVFPLLLFFVYVLLVSLIVHHFVYIENMYVGLLVAVISIGAVAVCGSWLLLLQRDEKQWIKFKILEMFHA